MWDKYHPPGPGSLGWSCQHTGCQKIARNHDDAARGHDCCLRHDNCDDGEEHA